MFAIKVNPSRLHSYSMVVVATKISIIRSLHMARGTFCRDDDLSGVAFRLSPLPEEPNSLPNSLLLVCWADASCKPKLTASAFNHVYEVVIQHGVTSDNVAHRERLSSPETL